MKLTKDDIKIQNRNDQIKNRIRETFGSLEKFAEAAGMSIKTVKQYLGQSEEFSQRFKGILAEYLGDYKSLFRSETEQVEGYVDRLVADIHFYTEPEDLEVLEWGLKMAEAYELVRCMAKGNWNLGMYYLNRGQYDTSMYFFGRGRELAQKVYDYNTECLVVLKMITVYTYMEQYREGRKLGYEFEGSGKIEKVDVFGRFWFYYSQAVLYVHDLDYTSAEGALGKAEKVSENNYRKFICYNLLGVCYKKDRKFERAVKSYKQALEYAERDADKAICYNNTAELYREMGLHECAIQNLDDAMKHIKPHDTENYIRVYQTYIEIYDDEESLNKFLDILENISQIVFMTYIIDGLAIAVNKAKNYERIKNIIIRQIELNHENDKILLQLYALLGRTFLKMEVKRK